MFEPQLNEQITINKEFYLFVEHPGFKGHAYAQEGKKAVVYKIMQQTTGNFFALKVFKHAFQDPRLITHSSSLTKLRGIDGMSVCNRTCITAKDNPELITMFPELNYSLLMPWIDGSTWFDIIFNKRKLTLDDSLEVAKKIIDVLADIEAKGYAHCDISSANVIFACENTARNEILFHRPLRVELIDVEDIYGPDLDQPTNCPMGTDGYHHPTRRSRSNGQWCKEGDRFSAAILISELLCWHDPTIRQTADSESYFSGNIQNIQDAINHSRYQLLIETLNKIGEPLKDCFEAVWNSNDLDECPSIVSWKKALASSLSSVEKLRRELSRAINNGDIQEIIHVGKKIREYNYPMTQVEWQAYLKAHHAQAQHEKLDQAFEEENEIEILSAFDRSTMKALSPDIQARIDTAQRRLRKWVVLRRALDEKDDIAICTAFDNKLFGNSSLLSSDDHKQIRESLHRRDLALALRSAFATQDPQQIVKIDPDRLLRNSNLLTYGDRRKLNTAYQRLNQLPRPHPGSTDKNLVFSPPDKELDIIDLWQRGQIRIDLLSSDDERRRVLSVVRKHGRILRIQSALQRNDCDQVRRLYRDTDLAQSDILLFDLKQKIDNFLSSCLDQQ